MRKLSTLHAYIQGDQVGSQNPNRPPLTHSKIFVHSQGRFFSQGGVWRDTFWTLAVFWYPEYYKLVTLRSPWRSQEPGGLNCLRNELTSSERRFSEKKRGRGLRPFFVPHGLIFNPFFRILKGYWNVTYIASFLTLCSILYQPRLSLRIVRVL